MRIRNFTSVTKVYDFTGKFDNYKVVENGVTFQVPLNEANVDYQEIQEWAKIEGNTIIDNPPE